MKAPAAAKAPAYGPPGPTALGMKYRRRALISGIVGLFVMGIPLGMFAFMQSRLAESEGVRSRAGKVLGIIDVVLGAIVVQVWLRTMR